MKWGFIIGVIVVAGAIWGVREVDNNHLRDYAKTVAIENREALVARCQASNKELRKKINAPVNVLREFITSAIQARESAGMPNDLRAAAKYRNERARLKNLNYPVCEDVIAPVK
jgi:hypothetical protein